MEYTIKATAASIARAILIALAGLLIKNGLDETAANDFVSANVDVLAGLLVAVGTVIWMILKNRFSNVNFWKARTAEPETSPEVILEETKQTTGLPKLLKF
jgi:hypothetical protein